MVIEATKLAVEGWCLKSDRDCISCQSLFSALLVIWILDALNHL